MTPQSTSSSDSAWPRAERWRHAGEPMAEFLRFFGGLPDVPPVAGARPETELLGYGDYPNLIRQPVWESVAFVGEPFVTAIALSGPSTAACTCMPKISSLRAMYWSWSTSAR